MHERVTTADGFDRARAEWLRSADEGRLEDALAILESALPWVESCGQPALKDRVFCNRARLAAELGLGDPHLAGLRDILVRRDDSENDFLAAAAIARIYELRKDYRKSYFYAQIARERAQTLGSDEYVGSSLNLLANILVAESRFEEAAATYAEAVSLGTAENALWRAVVSYNLGYCRVVLGSASEGFGLLYRAVRLLRGLRSGRHEMLARLDLAFCHLEAGKPRCAARHAARARELAQQFGESEARRNALFLLGSAASRLGDLFTAKRWFRELQVDFYPDSDYLPDLLLAVDVRKLVNLKA